MAIRGKPLSLIRSTLDPLRAELGSVRSKFFIVSAGGVGVPARKLLTSWGASRAVLKGLKDGLPALLRLPASVDTLRVKNNARLFCRDRSGGGPAVTVKIGLESVSRGGSLAREIKAHKLLCGDRREGISIPRLVRYAPNLTWLVEEFVQRCPERDREAKAELFLRRDAKHLYAPFVRSRAVSLFLRGNGIAADEVVELFASAGTTLPKSVLSATWPVALLHGDLSEGNMIATREGKLYVVDWEKFRRGPVAWDMRKLFHILPREVHALLNSLLGDHDLDADMQMRIVSAAELILVARKRAKKITYLTADRGVTEARARELIERQAMKRIDVIKQSSSRGV